MPLPPGRPPSVTMSSSPSNSSFVKSSQDSFTAGNPVLRDLLSRWNEVLPLVTPAFPSISRHTWTPANQPIVAKSQSEVLA